MQNINFHQSPSAGIVVPHYIFAAFSFLILSFCVLISTDFLAGHYFQPRLLALTHLAALGWGTMIIFGVLYQFLPVILCVPLYSEKLARFSFYLLASGTVLLVIAFWNFLLGSLMHSAMALVSMSVILFCINAFKTASKSRDWSIESDFILTSCIWLLITVLLGSVLALNLTNAFLSQDHLVYLKIHAHTGIIGWFLLLICGVTARLFPMFLLAHHTGKKLLNITYYLINGGLAAFSIDLFFWGGVERIFIYAILILVAIIFYLSFIVKTYLNRKRKVSDTAMKQSLMAMILLLLPVVTGVSISFNSGLNTFMTQIYLIYGVSIFLGFLTALILGQTFKTLPFIMWMYFFKGQVGKKEVPLPKDLYSENILKWQMIIYLCAFTFIITGIFTESGIIKITAGTLLLITAVLYNINVFKILLYPFLSKKNF